MATINTFGGYNIPFNLTYGTSGSGYTYSAGGNYGFYVGQDWPLDTNGRASGHSMSWYGYTSTGGIDYATYAGTSQAQRWNGNRLAARSRSTDRRWEYRYNERGEVTSAWQQSDTNVANVTSGEPLAGSGSTYSYDAIGNRASHVEGGPATSTAGTAPNGLPSSTLGLNASRTHNYTGNAANQYTSITHPQVFDVRGTRTAGATIAVNGVAVANPPTSVSGYQPAPVSPSTTPGNIFRAEVANTAPTGTTSPDIYQPVGITQNGTALTPDDPVQYVPLSPESLTYDADGNLLTDGRNTYTYDAADRLIKVETPAFVQPAASPLAAVSLPARVTEYGYDGLSRRISKKVTETPTGGSATIAVWEAYVYDGWNLILNVKLNPTAGATQGRPQSLNANYVWGPDLGSKPFARRDWQAAGGVRGLLMAIPSNTSQMQLPVHDPMGNIVQVIRVTYGFFSYTPTTFRTDFVYDYDAFGKETRCSSLVSGLSPDSFPFHYSTKFMDPETGFNYYGYRMYDPANGRWLSRDPIEERGGVNLYNFLTNDPANWVDFLGLVDMSYTPPDQTDLTDWEKTFDTGKYDVAGHGKEGGGSMFDKDGKEISPDKVADDIAKDPKYKPGQTVGLIVCQAGKGDKKSFAQKLADALAKKTGKKTKVRAAETDVYPGKPGGKPSAASGFKTYKGRP